MTRWSFYNLASGEFTGRTLAVRDKKEVERNTPAGCGAIEGNHDHLSRRVDLTTMEVVEWENTRLIEAAAKRVAVMSARSRIAELETRQLRAMRDDALRPNEKGQDGKSARDRLREIDDEIAQLREVLNGGTGTSARSG